MRIYVPGPGYPDSFADNVAVTLQDMGHEVLREPEYDSNKHRSVLRRVRMVGEELLFRNRPSLRDLQILRQAKAFRPDVFLSLTMDIHPEVGQALGKLTSKRRLVWWGDPAANSKGWGLVSPEWDHLFVKDEATAHKLTLLGRDSRLLHEAMNPRWHKPVATQANGQIAVVGNLYTFRQAMVQRLIGSGENIAIYGAKPPRWSIPEVSARWVGRHVVREEKSRVFGEALVCLNTFTMAEGNSLNCRAFEVSGAGGLHVVEHRSALSQCFEPEREMLVFHTYEELLAHLDRARRFPAEMVPIRQAAARRALADHTYRHRLEVMLSTVQ